MYKHYIKTTTQKTRKWIYNLLLIGPILLVIAIFMYNSSFVSTSSSVEISRRSVLSERDVVTTPQPEAEAGDESESERNVVTTPQPEAEAGDESESEHGDSFGEMSIKEHVEFWRDSLVSLTPLLVSLFAFLGRRKVVGDA